MPSSRQILKLQRQGEWHQDHKEHQDAAEKPGITPLNHGQSGGNNGIIETWNGLTWKGGWRSPHPTPAIGRGTFHWPRALQAPVSSLDIGDVQGFHAQFFCQGLSLWCLLLGVVQVSSLCPALVLQAGERFKEER